MVSRGREGKHPERLDDRSSVGEACLLFVYGSLLAGEENHSQLAGAVLVREARTRPAYRLVDLGPYPAMSAGGDSVVVGQLYLVERALLAQLDAFEGHTEGGAEGPTEHVAEEARYRRCVIELEDGALAQAYLLPATMAGEVIACGDYRRHRRRR